ncbi:hypothetical protein [Dongshaea marina]|uniref:hypothetical protein n=1 Tax=Dongshaea marina TaxID=2047966 RepID=UPI000D3E8C60|nr:hypothetical protein [Dongshaea marina]
MERPQHSHYFSLSCKIITTILFLLTLIISIYGFVSQRHLRNLMDEDLQLQYSHYQNDYDFLLQQLTDHLVLLGEQVGNFFVQAEESSNKSGFNLLKQTWPNLQLLANIDGIALYGAKSNKPILRLSSLPDYQGGISQPR